MPTYEYRCADCGHTFDIVQAFTDAALTECPDCGGRLKKVFGSVGIAFKGSGFYVNDSGSKKSSTMAAGSSDSSSSGDSASNGADSGSSKTDASKSPDASTAKTTSKAKANSSTD